MYLDQERMRTAHAVRQACIVAARRAYVDAAQSGLCGDGAFEAAVGAMQTLDLDALVRTASLPGGE